jgi:hypothetical protein
MRAINMKYLFRSHLHGYTLRYLKKEVGKEEIINERYLPIKSTSQLFGFFF